MEIHVAIAELPAAVEVVAEQTSNGIHLIVRQGLSQGKTAAAVAEVVCNALSEQGP